jgi:hypothetical protein
VEQTEDDDLVEDYGLREACLDFILEFLSEEKDEVTIQVNTVGCLEKGKHVISEGRRFDFVFCGLHGIVGLHATEAVDDCSGVCVHVLNLVRDGRYCIDCDGGLLFETHEATDLVQCGSLPALELLLFLFFDFFTFYRSFGLFVENFYNLFFD